MPYIGKSPNFGVRNRFVYTVDASATSVSGGDDNGATLTFTDGAYVDVYVNGVLLKSGTDYNTNTANTIAGISSMTANDEVTVVVYDVFSVADMVSATSGGTFSGNVTMNGTLDVAGDVSLDGGSFVFNESSADKDFRVESNGNTHMLFVDGGNDRVGIGTTSPHADLHIQNETGTNTGSTELNLWVNDSRGRSKFNLKSTDDGTDIGTFKLTTESTAPSNSDLLIMNNQGMMTIPNQPAFQIKPTSDQTDIAVGSDVTIAFGTEIFDQNADFDNSSSTFTAPITGKYQINVHVLLTTVDSAATLYQLKIITSNRTYFYTIDTDFGQDAAFFPVQNNILADMDANDTCVVKIKQTGGSQQTDISSTTSVFSGYLVC